MVYDKSKKILKNYSEQESDTGYILEVDVKYPQYLHKHHNEFPFLPEKLKLGKVEKLTCNLMDKKKYVIHIEALQQAMKHGINCNKDS